MIHILVKLFGHANLNLLIKVKSIDFGIFVAK